MGHSTTSHADGLAWLFLAWLAQILLLIKYQNLFRHFLKYQFYLREIYAKNFD
jgi:hypothetical protein